MEQSMYTSVAVPSPKIEENFPSVNPNISIESACIECVVMLYWD